MLTKSFWTSALERAVKTAAQVLLVTFFAADQAANAWEMDWADMGGVALAGAILSILTSLVSAPFGDKGDPSLVSKG